MAPAGAKSALTCKTDDEQKAWCQSKCDSYNATTGNLNEFDGYDCPECKNKGMVAEPKKNDAGHWYEAYYRCKCDKSRKAIRQLKKSGLQNIIRDYTFKAFKADEPWQKAIKEAAVRFVHDDDHTWFFIGGTSGCGKTHICTAIAAHYLRKGKSVRYMLWRDDVVKLKASVTDHEVYDNMIHEFKTADVLYIDDLFKTGKANDGTVQRPTAADINIAFELLNYRYNNPSLVTIVSSECRVTEILDIDEAVGGRIAERTPLRPSACSNFATASVNF